MRRAILLIALVALVGCDQTAEVNAPVTETEYSYLGNVVEVLPAGELSQPRLTEDGGLVQYDGRHEDRRFTAEGIALSPRALPDRISPNSALVERNSVQVFGLEGESRVVRLTDGARTVDVPLADDEVTKITSDGRLMVRTIHTLGWTVYSVDGTVETFDNPADALVFDLNGDRLLIGKKVNGERTLWVIQR